MLKRPTVISWGQGAQDHHRLSDAQVTALYDIRAGREPRFRLETYAALERRGFITTAPNYGEAAEAGEMALTEQGLRACDDLFDTDTYAFLKAHPEVSR